MSWRRKRRMLRSDRGARKTPSLLNVLLVQYLLLILQSPNNRVFVGFRNFARRPKSEFARFITVGETNTVSTVWTLRTTVHLFFHELTSDIHWTRLVVAADRRAGQVWAALLSAFVIVCGSNVENVFARFLTFDVRIRKKNVVPTHRPTRLQSLRA